MKTDDYRVRRLADGGRIYMFYGAILPTEAGLNSLNRSVEAALRTAKLPKRVSAEAFIANTELHIVVTAGSGNSSFDFQGLDTAVIAAVQALP